MTITSLAPWVINSQSWNPYTYGFPAKVRVPNNFWDTVRTQFAYMWVPAPKLGNPAVTSLKLVPKLETEQQDGFFILKVTFLL